MSADSAFGAAGVGLAVGVAVGLAVGVGVVVGLAVAVGVGLGRTVAVAVAEGVGLGRTVAVAVAVAVAVGLAVGVAVGVGVGVAVGEGEQFPPRNRHSAGIWLTIGVKSGPIGGQGILFGHQIGRPAKYKLLGITWSGIAGSQMVALLK